MNKIPIEPMEIRTQYGGEKVYAQTDFHAGCDFQRARGRVELVSCKQEH